MRTNSSSVRTNLGRSKNQRRVYIDDGVTSRLNPLQSLVQENRGVGSLPLSIGRRKQRPDIRRSDGSEQRIGDGVQKYVTVRVAAQAFRMIQSPPANLKRNASLEFVRIPAKTNSHAETSATDFHGFSRIFFLSLLKRSLRNWGRVPKLSNIPTSISVDFK